MRKPSLAMFALVAAFGASGLHAYIRNTFSFTDGSAVPQRRVDGAGIQFYVNSKIGPNFQSSASGSVVTVISAGSDPVLAIQAALSAWNGIAGANLKFLPLKTTDKINSPDDNQMTVVVGSTPADLSALGGALAITSVQSTSFIVGSEDLKGVIADTDIIFNPAVSFSTDRSTSNDFQAVMTHELGHALGLNHSGLLGSVMFQFAAFNARYLTPDEVGFAAAVYPATASNLGTISGKIVAADASAVQTALVTLLDTTTGTALSALSAADGTYSLKAIPGNYLVYAEPLGAGSIVQPGNLYLTTATKVTTNFQVTMLGGFSAPTRIAVTAGNTATVPNLTVTAGTSSLAWPYIGTGTAAAAGGGFNVVSGALLVNSGQAVDLQMIGGGVDGTVSVQAFGRGITVRPGTVRADPAASFGGSLSGQPLIRVTVDLAAVETPTLVTLILTKGSNVFPISGAFVLVPPKPTFVTAGVDSAASAMYLGEVSAGGLSSIYNVPGLLNLGPAVPVGNGGYDAYGKLPFSLAGVTVTFDGVPAPLFFVYGGQINLQVPFEVAGKTSTKVVVNYQGSVSASITVPVVPAQPAFFTVTPGGKDVITQNFPEFTLNTAANPIARGAAVLLFGTGIGKLSYPLTTGQPGVVPPGNYSSTYSCSFGGKSSAAYAYWYFGFVGLAEWTVAVPGDAPTGAVTVTCRDSVTGASTPAATIFVK